MFGFVCVCVVSLDFSDYVLMSLDVSDCVSLVYLSTALSKEGYTNILGNR